MAHGSDLELFFENLRRFLDEARAFQIMDDNLARLRLHDPDTALLTVGFLDAHCDPRLSDEQARGQEAYINAKHVQNRLDLWTSLFTGTRETRDDTT